MVRDWSTTVYMRKRFTYVSFYKEHRLTQECTLVINALSTVNTKFIQVGLKMWTCLKCFGTATLMGCREDFLKSV